MNKEDYNKFYIQGSDHYLIPKDVFNELFDEMINWKEEVKELKKQLEDANEKILLLQASEPMLNYKKSLEENQQKEFINYLEDEYTKIQSEIEKETNNNNAKYFKIERRQTITGILQKYKEIIGDDK